jgi:glutaredoxin-like protein
VSDVDAPVTVLWRPGCPFCAMLLRRLERSGLTFDRVDIWEDPEAAAWVRSVADGNETVPTVRIVGADPDEAVALVNPSVSDVLAQVARLAPAALPGARRTAAPSGAWSSVLFARLERLRGRRDRARGPGAPR